MELICTDDAICVKLVWTIVYARIVDSLPIW